MRLDALREALGTPTLRPFRRLIAQLCLAEDSVGSIGASNLESIFGRYAARIRSNELLAVLVSVGVLRTGKQADSYVLAYDAIASLGSALAFADNDDATHNNAWLPVATIPDQAIRVALTGTLLQTAGVIFGLIEQAQTELWIVTPFLDLPSVEFLRGPIVAAISRGAEVRILTTERNESFIEALVEPIEATQPKLQIWYADAALSDLGSHAKAVVADRNSAYLGSANLTSYGLAKHFEIGAVLKGPEVSTLVMLFEILTLSGRLRAANDAEASNQRDVEPRRPLPTSR